MVVGDLLIDPDQVFFLDPRRGVDDPVSQVSIVGDDEEPCGLLIEPTDREEALFCWKEVND